jgi:DNA processing protein
VLATRQSDRGHVSALAVLERELGLMSYEALSDAELQLGEWARRGYQVLSSSASDYPANLRVVESRPALLFVAGRLDPADQRSVAVIGTREPTDTGRALAREISRGLATAGFAVVSGLAAGIDAEAHEAVLALSRERPQQPVRTVAVIGNGLDHAYPREHAGLQKRIADAGAVVSQFWPEAAPTRQSFPARNAVMSGMTLGSVIVEASEHSGTRVQARHALDQRRMVVLMSPVLANDWARELVDQSGVVVAEDAAAVVRAFRR